MIRQDIRKIITSPYYYAAILLVGIIMSLLTYEEIKYEFVYLFLTATYGGLPERVIPLLTGLAFADIYCVECRDGYHYSMLIRSSKEKYCFSKILTGALSGFTVVLFGIYAG